MANFLQDLFNGIGQGIRNVVTGVTNFFNPTPSNRPERQGSPAPTPRPVKRRPTIRPVVGPGPGGASRPQRTQFERLLEDTAQQTAEQTGTDAPSFNDLQSILQGNQQQGQQGPIRSFAGGSENFIENDQTGSPPLQSGQQQAPPGMVQVGTSLTGLPIFGEAPANQGGQPITSTVGPDSNAGQQVVGGGSPAGPSQLDLLNSILQSQQAQQQAGAQADARQQEAVTDQLNQLAEQNSLLANQLAEQLNLPAPEAVAVQPGDSTTSGPSATGSSITAVDAATPQGFNEQFLANLAQNLRGSVQDGQLPFSTELNQPGGFFSFGQGDQLIGQPGVFSPGTGPASGGAGAAGRQPTRRTPIRRTPVRGEGAGTVGVAGPDGVRISDAERLGGQTKAAEQQATQDAAETAGAVDANGKPLPGFDPIRGRDGNPIVNAPQSSEGTQAAQTELQDLFEQFPVLQDFVDPIAFQVDSPFLGQFSLRQSDLEGQRMIQVPQLDQFGQSIPGTSATIFSDPTTQKQIDFNLAAQPEATQAAFFQTQVEQSGLAQQLQQNAPQATPEAQPDPLDALFNDLISSQLSSLFGPAPGGDQIAAAPAPQFIESAGPPEFPGGPPTRIVEEVPLTLEDVGAGVDVGGGLGGTSGLLSGGAGNSPDLAALLSNLLNQSSAPLGA